MSFLHLICYFQSAIFTAFNDNSQIQLPVYLFFLLIYMKATGCNCHQLYLVF